MDTWIGAVGAQVDRKRRASGPTPNWPTEMDHEALVGQGAQDAREAQLVERSEGWAFATRATGWARPLTSDLFGNVCRPAAEFDASTVGEGDELLDDDGELDDEFEDDGQGDQLAW